MSRMGVWCGQGDLGSESMGLDEGWARQRQGMNFWREWNCMDVYSAAGIEWTNFGE